LQGEGRPAGVPAQPLQALAIALVDPDARVERETVEGRRAARVLERVGEAQAPVDLGGLERGELGGVLHPAGVAGGADVGLAGGGEGDEPLETAVRTADSRETSGEDAAVEIRPQLALDRGRQASTVRGPRSCGGEERLEPLADDLVEEGLLGLAPPIPAERRGGGAAVVLPGRGVLGRGRHARAHRKRRALATSTMARAAGDLTFGGRALFKFPS